MLGSIWQTGKGVGSSANSISKPWGCFFLMSFSFQNSPPYWGRLTTPQPSASPVLSAAPLRPPAAAQEIRADLGQLSGMAAYRIFSSEIPLSRADAAPPPSCRPSATTWGKPRFCPMCGPLEMPCTPAGIFPFSHLCTGTQGHGPRLLTRLPCHGRTRPIAQGLTWKPGFNPTACRPTEPR